jgi:hypothetical protein
MTEKFFLGGAPRHWPWGPRQTVIAPRVAIASPACTPQVTHDRRSIDEQGERYDAEHRNHQSYI